MNTKEQKDYIVNVSESTRKSAETIGESLKIIYSRVNYED